MKTVLYFLLILFFSACSLNNSLIHVNVRNPSSTDELAELPSAIKTFIYSEQMLNDRIEDTSEFASIVTTNLEAEYMPENQPVFKLHTVLVPIEDLTILSTDSEENINNALIVIKDRKKFVKFFIHPKSVNLYADAFKNYQWTEEILSTPLSSHRSLVAWNPNSPTSPFGIKLSLDVKIGGAVRNLSEGQIEHAYIVSSLLKTLDKNNLKKRGIIFLDESINIIPKKVQYGFTLRDIPLPKTDSKVIPMFSLYSKGINRQTPLLADIILKNKVSPQEYIRNKIIRPLIDKTLFMVFSEGLIGEYHEQNVLVELNNGDISENIWFRDLAGFSVNKDFRTAVGKDMKFVPPDVQIKNLHMEDHSDIVRNLELYIKKSNFYAMQVSMSEYFPEITQEWVSNEFEKTFKESVKKYTGVQTSWKNFKTDAKKIINRIKLHNINGSNCNVLIEALLI